MKNEPANFGNTNAECAGPAAAQMARRIGVLLPMRELFSPRAGGAVARVVYESCRRPAPGARFEIFARTGGTEPYDLPASGDALRFDLLANSKLARSLCGGALARAWCRAHLEAARRCDALCIHHAHDYARVLRALGCRAPLLLYMHNPFLERLDDAELDYLNREVARIVVCGDDLKSGLARRAPALAHKIDVAPNGVDAAQFAPAPRRARAPRLLFAGRIAREKGVLELLDAFDGVLDALPAAELWIVGAARFGGGRTTRYEKQCRLRAARLERRHAGAVRWHGYARHRNLPAVMRDCAALAAPSHDSLEGLPLTVLEAAACGLPVVGTRARGMAQAIGPGGLLVAPGDADALRGALLEILGDADKADALGRAGRAHAARFTWERTRDALLASVERALA